MNKLKVVRKHKVERTIIEVSNDSEKMELIRLKNYNSETGLSNITWKFKEDLKTVKDEFSERLEREFLRSQRKTALITNNN